MRRKAQIEDDVETALKKEDRGGMSLLGQFEAALQEKVSCRVWSSPTKTHREKLECRSSKSETSEKSEFRMFQTFGIRICFEFRHSGFDYFMPVGLRRT
jgi:hypothetical protein